MRVVMEDLALSRPYVVHPGTARYGLGDQIQAIGLSELLTELGSNGRKKPKARRRSAEK